MKLLATLFLIIGLLLVAPPIVKSVLFTQDCKGHLELAANSNTIPTAVKELGAALTYIESNDLTKGFTSVLWRTPDEDIGFWYNNLKATHAELISIPADASPLEKSNMLIKLRETILAHGDHGEYVTVPEGIHKYPSNAAWAVAVTIGTILILGSIGIFFIELHDL